MKPNFALSLSFEGIRLLHRSGAGWTVVGDVPLDEPDLAGGLAALRATAVGLEPGGLRTKLLLPPEQVKAIDVASPGADAARTALEGATPYAVADLVVDHLSDGTRHRAVAVARETLEEAEAFAAEHRFHPVAFAAVLPEGEWPAEAFFGESKLARAAGQRVERDDAPTLARRAAPLGAAPAEPLALSPDPATAPADQDAEDRIAPATGPLASAGSTTLPPETPEPQQPEPVAKPATEPDASLPFAATAAAPSEPAASEGISAAPEGAAVAPLSGTPENAAVAADALPLDVDAAPVAPHLPAPEFSTVQRPEPDPTEARPVESQAEERQPAAPESDVSEPSWPEPSPPAASEPAEAPLGETGIPEPVFASRARPQVVTAEAAPVLVGATRVPLRAPPRSPPSASSGSGRGGRVEPPVLRTAAPQPGQVLQAPPPPARRDAHAPVAPRPRVLPAVAPMAVAADADASAFEASPTRPAPGSVPESPSRRPPEPRPPREADARWAEAAARSRGRPRFLGLILTVVLLLAMLAVGVWASATPEGIAGLFRRPAEPIAAAADDTATDLAPEAADTELAAGLAIAPDLAGPEPLAPVEPAPDETAAAAAAVAAAIEALPLPEPDIELAASRPGEPGTPVSAAEADRIYAATGVWLRAPRLPDTPRAEAGAAAAVPAALTAERPATEVTSLPAASADASLPAQAAPPPPGTTFARDAEGLILATPEGTVTPGGAIVFAGAPSKVPPTRPGAVAAGLVAATLAGPAGPGAPVAPAAAGSEIAVPVLPTFVNAMAEAPGKRPTLRPADPTLPESMVAAVAPGPAPLGQPGTAAGGIDPEALGPLPGLPGSLAFAEGTTADPAAAGSVAPGAVALASFEGSRPPLRPEGLAPPAPEVLSGFAGPRPGPRPGDIAPPAVVADAAEDLPTTDLPATDPAAIDAAVAAAQAAAAPAPPTPEAAPAPPVPDVQSALASIVAGAPDPLAGATRQAVALASRPDSRPRNFDRVVQDQLARSARAAQPAADASAAPRSGAPEDVEAGDPEVASAAAAAPSGPTPGSVAQTATFSDAMALREMNLIGVFGQPGDRRALVRMGNGRYLRVGVGDSLDGGQVTAIGDNALNYTKRGRQMQLVIPGG